MLTNKDIFVQNASVQLSLVGADDEPFVLVTNQKGQSVIREKGWLGKTLHVTCSHEACEEVEDSLEVNSVEIHKVITLDISRNYPR
ncbi:MAG: hypothetical protein R2795_25575 [Saprospiraceae bacterium]